MPKGGGNNALEVMNTLFQQSVDKDASDLHLVVGASPILRIDGDLVHVEGAAALTPEQTKQLTYSFLSEESRQTFEREKELDVAHQIPSGTRFRINLHWEKGNVAMAARAIPSKIPTMEWLGVPPVMRHMTTYPNGLVIVTGPTGSGKSTDLAALIEDINQREPVNIITLEDPIEFLFEGKQAAIRQRQLGQDFLSYAEGLKHILRQDPDVVMVGEMRDPETIAATLTIAETGHLVFATLHTNSAAETIDRIIDSFPSHQQNQVRAQLAMTLRGVVSKQLLPMAGGGRIAAREILVNTPAVANLVRESKIAQIRNAQQTSAAQGMRTMGQDLQRLLKEGKITQETVRAFVVNTEAAFDEDGGTPAAAPAAAKKKGWF